MRQSLRKQRSDELWIRRHRRLLATALRHQRTILYVRDFLNWYTGLPGAPAAWLDAPAPEEMPCTEDAPETPDIQSAYDGHLMQYAIRIRAMRRVELHAADDPDSRRIVIGNSDAQELQAQGWVRVGPPGEQERAKGVYIRHPDWGAES